MENMTPRNTTNEGCLYWKHRTILLDTYVDRCENYLTVTNKGLGFRETCFSQPVVSRERKLGAIRELLKWVPA